jgi:Protein of unknown function, DUF547
MRQITSAVLTAMLVGWAAQAQASAGAALAAASEQAYADVLQRFVTVEGRVRYAALKADPAQLDAFLAGIAAGAPTDLAALPRADRIAFWINAYNAITLKTIVANYPIRPHGLFSWRYPSSSIRQIPGAWTNREWTVLGERVSLDDIENRELRAAFAEPRVHMALVCAARGCPPLRNEPYGGARLDQQLDDQARRYLASPAGMRVQPGGRGVAVSSIFTWFAGDFVKTGGVRAFLARYAPAADRAAVADASTRITYLDYDWTLNDAQGE